MTIKRIRFFVCIAIVAFCASRASAVVLFSDDFNINSSGSWTVNTAPSGTTVAGQQQATFAYDYSGMGIPPAPGSTDTLGLRLRANIPGSAVAPVTTRPTQVLSGLSVSPTGQNFGTSYKLSFYAWSNFFGAANASGLADNAASEGGTNNVLFAVGTSGTVPLVVGNTGLAANASMDGIGFATTPDGGITSDWRVYPASGTIVPPTTAGVYAAGASATANQNVNAYYATTVTTLGAHTAPAVQQGLANAEYGSDAAPVMAGSTQAGSFGFAWHKVVITKNGNIVSWNVDDFPIATYTVTGALGGANIALGESDVNTGTARHPSLLFTVFDNLTVTDVPAAPAGDFNSDGKVDAGDFVSIRKQFSDITSGAGLTAINAWRQNFGNPLGAGTSLDGSAVPEPSSLFLLVACTGCCWGVRRRL